MDINDDFKNILKTERPITLDEELKNIDKQFENDIETFNLMEENNFEVMKSLNLDSSISNLNQRKFENVLDNKIIIDSIKLAEKNLIAQSTNAETGLNISKEDEIKILLQSKYFLLNDKKITIIANLDIYENLSELYLQRNFIRQMEGFKYLKNLQILNLNNNYIKKIENINYLNNLEILDLADNLIDKLEINSLPLNIVYLYLFDNLFYDNISIFNFRSLCIRHLNKLERLDYLTITDKEKFILIDESNLIKKRRLAMVKDKLKYIKDHYNEIKSERKTLLQEFEKSTIDNNKETEENEVNHDQEDPIIQSNLFVTNNKTNFDVNSIKIRSENRIKEFEISSNERMKDIKEKLAEIRNKFQNMPLIDESRKDKIKNKINSAIKTEEKIKKAEELNRRINERQENRETIIRNIQIKNEITEANEEIVTTTEIDKEENNYLMNSTITEVDLNKSHMSQMSQMSNKNSLLSDKSDICYLKHNK